MLTLLMVFFTTTSVSCTSVDFSLRAEAEAKTLSLERNWFEVGSASSSRFSGDSSSRWNFFTLKMLELEMDSCSSSCLLYILIFSFSLSRESWRMMMFFLSSSGCRISSFSLTATSLQILSEEPRLTDLCPSPFSAFIFVLMAADFVLFSFFSTALMFMLLVAFLIISSFISSGSRPTLFSSTAPKVLGELLGEVVVGEVPEQLRLLLAEQAQPDLGSELLDHNLAAFEVLDKHEVPEQARSP